MTPEARLDVTADLHVDLDGVPASIRGTGQRVEAYVEDVGAVLDQLRSVQVPGRRTGLAQVADALSGAGVGVTVTGPRGPLLDIGSGASSPLLGRVLGSPHIAVRSRRQVASIGGRLVAQAAREQSAYLAGATAALLGGLLIRQRLRARH